MSRGWAGWGGVAARLVTGVGGGGRQSWELMANFIHQQTALRDKSVYLRKVMRRSIYSRPASIAVES